MIEKNFILTDLDEKQAALIEIDTNKKIFWPLEYLPNNIKIGESISIIVSLEKDLADRKVLAKDVLNEILDISE
ncbi:MAG TPA: hypothetical protein PK142_01910 [bacterium]|nr:hypothetical protein [bacterium]